MEHTNTELMVTAAADRLQDGDTVLVGIGVPNLACNLAKRTHAPELTMVYESGVVDADPDSLPLSIGDPALVSSAMNLESLHGGFTLTTVGSGVIVLLGAIAITHGLNCASRPFGIPSPLSYGARAVFMTLGVFAMVWPATVPRVCTALVAMGLIPIQTQLPRFSGASAVAEAEADAEGD